MTPEAFVRLTEAIAFRDAAQADGWEITPLYADESTDRAGRLAKDGFSMLVYTRPTDGKVRATDAGVFLFGPDKLQIIPPATYDWQAIQDGLRTCNYCGKRNVETTRAGFAARCCHTCLPRMQSLLEPPGWDE